MTEVIIDLEGCLRKGIREVGAIETKNFQVKRFWDISVKNEVDVSKALAEVFSDKPQYLVAHNMQIEKNLICKYQPYPTWKTKERTSTETTWGPWLDTKQIYSTLYPKLNNYTLQFLTETFIPESELIKASASICKKGRRKSHFALYDAMCTYLLIKRVSQVVDLKTLALF